ncbi:MAG: hypothetical protein HZA78_07730 [Candidatus Schekmanbacteria bacterium]|nr:hypothetical protein [Candidatus Schekmanbacteria bacterium]
MFGLVGGSVADTIYTLWWAVGGFLYIGILPLFLVLLIKRVSWQHPLIQHFNRCIRNGTSFSERDCQRVEIYLKEIENRFFLLKGQVLTPLQRAAPLNIAFKALPLLHRMAQENTCCALQTGHLPPFKRTFVCKQKIDEFLHKYAQDHELSLIADEIRRIDQTCKRIEDNKLFQQVKLLLFTAVFFISSYFVNVTIKGSILHWEIKIAVYFISLAAFALNYDYYYSEKFTRYRTGFFTRIFKRK